MGSCRSADTTDTNESKESDVLAAVVVEEPVPMTVSSSSASAGGELSANCSTASGDGRLQVPTVRVFTRVS
ncbi:hypothetical protein R1flu_014404 [Riccia fluitans]|uniref:Uncharacterized protein n=1 Tax=Riccia fluitans TaxID=41844 RepID=A0ABD1YG10_9MARC